MEVCIIITGIARHVKDGYEQFYEPLIKKYNPDIFVYSWNDYEVNEIKKYYYPKKIKIVEPINFSEYSFEYSDKTYFKKYGGGSLLPMIYCWENAWKMIDTHYDCIIRSRFDVSISKEIKLENLDLSKINISNSHWNRYPVMDDNLLITNHETSNKIYKNIFTNISSKKNIHSINEVNITEYVIEQGLGDDVIKVDLPFKLIR